MQIRMQLAKPSEGLTCWCGLPIVGACLTFGLLLSGICATLKELKDEEPCPLASLKYGFASSGAHNVVEGEREIMRRVREIVRPSIHMSIYPSINTIDSLFVCQPIYPCTHVTHLHREKWNKPSVHIQVRPSINRENRTSHPSVRLSICPYPQLSINQSRKWKKPSIYPSVHQSISTIVHQSICPFVRLSIYHPYVYI